MIFAEANVPFNDVHSVKDLFTSKKNAGLLPYDQWPVLEVGGVVLAQSMTIARFLGNRFGLAGDNDIEEAKADGVATASYDLAQRIAQTVFSPAELKEESMNKLKTEFLPKTLAVLERNLTSDYFVGHKLTYADILMFGTFGFLKMNVPDALDAYPKLAAFSQRVASRPNIAKYLQKKYGPAPKYKLYYWGVKGRAESTRLIFAEANVEYTDVRASGPNDFSDMKATGTLPYDQWPVLEVDGTILAQSMAINRFLAGRFGLRGRNEIERAQADSVVEALYEAGQAMSTATYAPADKKEALMAKFKEEALPKFLTIFERNLTGEFAIGSQFTYADLVMFEAVRNLKEKFPGSVDAFPKINAHSARIASRPNLQKQLAL